MTGSDRHTWLYRQRAGHTLPFHPPIAVRGCILVLGGAGGEKWEGGAVCGDGSGGREEERTVTGPGAEDREVVLGFCCCPCHWPSLTRFRQHMALLAVTSAPGPLTCLTLFLAVYHALAVPPGPWQSRGRPPGQVKRPPGGRSRGGSSASRDELRHRLLAFYRCSVLEGFGIVQNKDPTPPEAPPCSLQSPDDLQRMLPDLFLSETDLLDVLSQTKGGLQEVPVASQGRTNGREQGQINSPALRRVVPDKLSDGSERQMAQEAATFGDRGDHFFESHSTDCRSCLTEIGYEVVEHVVDFKGNNHTVINFKNAYQFIPSGRCVNEHSPCGQPGWRCQQVSRAHWSLVWTVGVGVNLVAHEVPSHCQCLNLGPPRPHPAPRQRQSARRAGEKLRDRGWAGLHVGRDVTSANQSWVGNASVSQLSDTAPTHALPATPLPFPTLPSVNFPSLGTYPLTPNAYPASSNANPASSNANPASSNANPASSNANPASSNAYPASSKDSPFNPVTDPAANSLYLPRSDSVPVTSEPSPTISDPDPSIADPSTSGSHPYPVSSDPSPVSSNPGSTDPDPSPVGSNPGSTDPDPSPVGSNPGSTDPGPSPVGSNPGSTDPDPSPVGSNPGSTDPDPSPVGSNPGSTDPDPSPVRLSQLDP
ncbi:uncharacterized protein LOC143297476 [Babylonia areolata]|uniref:uncharacterized protein LOC143297476 n=1 Tax=Babylonia areolata TaxID=304850 RepID=UPI003FD25432